MERYINYNDLLSLLFKQWIENYDEKDRVKFCYDGIMYKNDPTLNVDLLWEQSKRRIMFILKDCPDGWGYDTREMLLDKIGKEKAIKNRTLEVKFLRNIAKLFYGLLEIKSDNNINDQYVNKRKAEVVEYWNTKPFAFVESKKLAGGKSVSENAIEAALEHDEMFLMKELDILRPNIIVCCNGSGDSIFNFITQKYYKGRNAQLFGGEYIVEGKTLSDMKTCLWYYPSENVVVIKAFHPSVASNWKVLEKVFSPFRAFMREINPNY